MEDVLPDYRERHLRSLLHEVRAVAAQKRLEAIFDLELFSFSRNVEAVLATPTPEAADAALHEGRELLKQLKDAIDKSDGILLR